MANIPKSQLDAVDTRVEVMLRRLFEGRTVNFEEINGVDIASPDDDDILFYNLTLDLWENHPLKTINGESLKGPGDISVGGGGGSGTVTSVAFTAPSQFAVSGSPITTSGTLALTWNNQVANRVLAGPATGVDAAPTFRALVADDIPGLPPDQIRNNTEERLLGWGETVSGDGNGALISTGTGFVWSGDSLTLSANLQGWHAIDPTTRVQSVNTRTGSVTLTDKDVPATVVTESGTSRAMANSDAGTYIRFTNTSAKTATFGTDLDVVGQEFHIRNVGTNDLTLTPSSTTLNAPSGGTLVVPTGGTCTVKQVASTEFDVFGTTTAA